MYKAILFDFGNTLAKSASLAKALDTVLDHEKAFTIGQNIENEIVTLYKPDQQEQPEWLEIWARCFRDADLPFDESIGRKHLMEFCRSNTLFPDVEEMLSRLKDSGYKLGLLSNATGPADIFQKDLEQRGLARYFNSIVWSCEIGYRKPYHKAFEAVLDRLGVSPADTLMIGDSEIADIQGATHLGMDSALVSSTQNPQTQARFCVAPDQLLKDVLALITLNTNQIT
ncbi:HAD family hydrolase [Endozoicomonas arenosclerae]|uniref:HAD family hydrolase n=1 Tax=Endozoicomonas arenosclerae TaxID=1633495 RepID=UPI00078550E0|nr:HAD family hydrolase [Endozoicomonas arenosclerae]